MNPSFDKEKIQIEMIQHFTKVYGEFPEILAKITANYKAEDHWNKGMTEAELRQTVRLLEDFKKGGKK